MQVCQNPSKLRNPTCVMWKDVPVLFFQEREKTWDTGLKPPPPPPPSSSLLKQSWIWMHNIWTPCAEWQTTVGGTGSACKVWVDSDILEISTLNLTYATAAQNHSTTGGQERDLADRLLYQCLVSMGCRLDYRKGRSPVSPITINIMGTKWW